MPRQPAGDFQEVEADAFAVEFMMPRWLIGWHAARQGWTVERFPSAERGLPARAADRRQLRGDLLDASSAIASSNKRRPGNCYRRNRARLKVGFAGSLSTAGLPRRCLAADGA